MYHGVRSPDALSPNKSVNNKATVAKSIVDNGLKEGGGQAYIGDKAVYTASQELAFKHYNSGDT